MLFAEEMNSYFGGPTFQPNPAMSGGAGPPPPSMDAWKGPNPAGTSGDYGGGGGYQSADHHGSKLITKWGHPMDYGKMPQQQQQQQNDPMAMGPYGGGPGAPWNEGYYFLKTLIRVFDILKTDFRPLF